MSALHAVRMAALTLVFHALAAEAGVVRGRVHITGDGVPASPAANAYPGRASSLARSHSAGLGGPSDAVVYIAALPASADSNLARRRPPRLTQKDQMFVPRVLVVVAGGSIDFPNEDPIYHNVFSVSRTRRFDLGKYPRGQSRNVSFPKPGVVNVFCDIHSDMAAFIVVVPNRAYAQPAADGAYALPPLPAGRYVVRFWHPDRPETQREVTVPAKGDVTLDATL